ncbi:hypothetical protein [Amycolatopsis sp. lyj-112]|uniref:hypothetical protein n=1 Tax=Amycolatopsis sp. lyj-112 TaxID=2789288 RepID=UPI00397807F4
MTEQATEAINQLTSAQNVHAEGGSRLTLDGLPRRRRRADGRGRRAPHGRRPRHHHREYSGVPRPRDPTSRHAQGNSTRLHVVDRYATVGT